MSLYLIPTFLSENNSVLSADVLDIIRSIDEFIVENEKSARQFLKTIQSGYKQSEFAFHLLNEHSTSEEINSLLKIIQKDKNIGLLSEAGCPAVADPGAAVVLLAHKNNVQVIPLTGPSSIMLALMSSGLNGQSFLFHGYLPRESPQRKNKLKLLEADAIKKNQTQIFIETPYRNMQLFADIIITCSESTLLSIACNLTSKEEYIMTQPISKWKKIKIDLNKKPTVFLIGM
jgi:16S rRNA (cytidine1402-2'-O)-methyltransferase